MYKQIFIIMAMLLIFAGCSTEAVQNEQEKTPLQEEQVDNTVIKGDSTETNKRVESNPQEITDLAVKEITMDSFTEVKDGKHFPQFSETKIKVKKGDTVRLKINVTSGKHDIRIDEFDVHADTPTGEITTIEFVADKTGEFVYYCHKPRHRELGHWGTLIVTE